MKDETNNQFRSDIHASHRRDRYFHDNNSGNKEVEIEDLSLLSRKWKHRRQMAYISIFSAILTMVTVVILAVTGHAGVLKDFNSIIVTGLAGFFSLAGAYMGLSTWSERR
jgi:hypothetical protein